MNLTNYHSHCSFCDGRAPFEEFVKEAISQGFYSYGVSSHAPLPFPTRWTMEWEQMEAYLDEFKNLRSKYADEIELYVGLEIDYLNEESNPSVARFTELPLDYRIGSVHLLYDAAGEVVDIDCSPAVFKERVDRHFNGDVLRVIRMYFDRLFRMVELGGFDILGHADKMHYNASCYHPGLLDEPWYEALMKDYFSLVASRGYLVEINTKAYDSLGTFYPNSRYWELMKEYQIKILVNSDAHYPERINAGRMEALRLLQAKGFATVAELHQGSWREVPIVV
ncbi:histidinol-phosphatase [Bacteroides graminisolvens]|uniref:histidinol-phosphatase n=1 Tax=Bacteroides graminisolvens TaxID=477666 RepID=UPI000A4FAC51|nr:histidinol-phosphatase [Bacteroides graminisolvens]MDD3210739.1 histidinol-phosphatase [Bacteroides graminisolvens]